MGTPGHPWAFSCNLPCFDATPTSRLKTSPDIWVVYPRPSNSPVMGSFEGWAPTRVNLPLNAQEPSVMIIRETAKQKYSTCFPNYHYTRVLPVMIF